MTRRLLKPRTTSSPSEQFVIGPLTQACGLRDELISNLGFSMFYQTRDKVFCFDRSTFLLTKCLQCKKKSKKQDRLMLDTLMMWYNSIMKFSIVDRVSARWLTENSWTVQTAVGFQQLPWIWNAHTCRHLRISRSCTNEPTRYGRP